MAAGSAELRELDPAERYYWLLDRVAPMNIVAAAELDRDVDATALAGALEAVRRRHPLLRARIAVADDGLLRYVEAAGGIPLEVARSAGSFGAAVAPDLDAPFGDRDVPLARARLHPRGGSALVTLTLHHAVGDGRAVVSALQQVLRELEQPGEAPPGGAVPVPLHDSYPEELRGPRAAVGVLGAIRDERAGQPEPSAFPFHDRSPAPKSTRLDRLVLAPAATAALRQQARAVGATVNGVVAAALLEVAAGLFGDEQERMLNLATPTDLRSRVSPPRSGDEVALAIGLLCTPYPASPAGVGDLAARVSAQTRREVERGESHLFYRFARAGSFAADDEGVQRFAEWFASTPPNVALSNLGVVDDTEDPPWVRSLTFSLSASPNQVAFVAATTYRGALQLHVATDRNRLAPDLADALVAGLAARLGATPDSS